MADWIVSLSPTLRLAATLFVIVVLMRLRLHMGWALAAGAVTLKFLFPMSFSHFLTAAGLGIFNYETLYLLAIVSGLLAYSAALHETSQTTRIVNAFRSIVGHSRLSLVTFPALIGFLPMPGGAIFSAPMVEAVAREANLSPQRLTISNYWFRHIWEYWLPIYPGVMVALVITKVPIGGFILREFPMTLVSLIFGYLIILRGIRLTGGAEHQRDISWPRVGAFLRELSPILIVLGVVALAILLDSALAQFDANAQAGEETSALREWLLRRISVLLAILLGALWLVRYRGFTWKRGAQLLVTKKVLSMCGLVFGVMFFRGVLENCGAVSAMQAEMEDYHIPLVAIICALPLISGIVTGIAFGFVTTSFPIVVELIADAPTSEKLAYVFLAYASGYVGMMLSPVHLCLILTNDYFKSHFGRVYFYLLPLSLCTLGCAFALYALYMRLA